MRHWLPTLLALTLSACAAGTPDNSPQAQCQRQAEDDPKVVEIYTRSNGAYTYAGNPERDALLLAKRDAMMKCLRAKGIGPPSGVQSVQPR